MDRKYPASSNDGEIRAFAGLVDAANVSWLSEGSAWAIYRAHSGMFSLGTAIQA